MSALESNLNATVQPRVLIVDDDPSVRDALKKVLHESGYSVRAAADGRQGALELEQHSFQLLVLDLDLPKISGWDLLDFVIARWPAMPIIILTAFSSQCVPGALSGTDILLEKPPDVDRLLEIMANLLTEPAEARLQRRLQVRAQPTGTPAPAATRRHVLGQNFLCV
jgi:DNA-binding response OmpR family regulator